MTVQDDVSVKRAFVNSSGVATFGPIDCERVKVGQGYVAVPFMRMIAVGAFLPELKREGGPGTTKLSSCVRPNSSY